MKTVTARQMQQVDKKASQIYALPPLILMENAAISSAFCVLQMLERGKRRVSIFCGQGNNGGDGFACARHLINRGLTVRVYFAGKEKKLSVEAKINYQILRKQGQKILKIKLAPLKRELKDADLIVDALLGIGIKSRVREPIFSLIEVINSSKKPILSLDIPSGLNATSGKVCGVAVRAKRTVTFGLLKKGLLHPRAREYTGKLILGDISLPPQLLS